MKKNMETERTEKTFWKRNIPEDSSMMILVIALIGLISIIAMAGPSFLQSSAVSLSRVGINIDTPDGNNYTAENAQRKEERYTKNQNRRDTYFAGETLNMYTPNYVVAGIWFRAAGVCALALILIWVIFLRIAKKTFLKIFVIAKKVANSVGNVFKKMSRKRRRRLVASGVRKVKVKQEFINVG